MRILEELNDSKKTIKEWKMTGLLEMLPGEKHQKIVDCFNVALEHVYNRKDKYTESYLGVFLPTIRRIFGEAEMNKNETIIMLDELNENWIEVDRILADEVAFSDYQKLGIDVEAEFCARFANLKVEELKKNQNK